MNQNIDNNSHRGSKSGKITFRSKQSKIDIDLDIKQNTNPLHVNNLLNSNIIDSRTSEMIKNNSGDKKKIKIEDIHSLRKTARDVINKNGNSKRYIISNFDVPGNSVRNTSPVNLFEKIDAKNIINSSDYV